MSLIYSDLKLGRGQIMNENLVHICDCFDKFENRKNYFSLIIRFISPK